MCMLSMPSNEVQVLCDRHAQAQTNVALPACVQRVPSTKILCSASVVMQCICNHVDVYGSHLAMHDQDVKELAVP